MPQSLNFLLVDDDNDDTFLFKEVVDQISTPITLHTAGDGLQALQKLETMQVLPDLIFLDLNMPSMGGKECLAQLKADENLSGIPVVMYTTSSQSKDIEETMMNGAAGFITKPTSIKELEHIVATLAKSLPNNLTRALQGLSNEVATFIVF
ncbi:MAG: response regulator [Chitinophagaceae bacterium]|nr:MAG: response regulator [Chitinophagaceae bacterium]